MERVKTKEREAMVKRKKKIQRGTGKGGKKCCRVRKRKAKGMKNDKKGMAAR